MKPVTRKAHVGPVVLPDAPLWRLVHRGEPVPGCGLDDAVRANTASEARGRFKKMCPSLFHWRNRALAAGLQVIPLGPRRVTRRTRARRAAQQGAKRS